MESRWIWPFELLDKLGEGGMGVVYRARYVGNNRQVAVKLIPEDISTDATLLARFERELEVLKQLNHPNIVHCFGGRCESKQRYYAMELIPGGTLAEYLAEKGTLPWETVVDFSIQMCAALQHAHEHGVIHRDIKPGNFLLTKAGQLKLSDFGLASVVAEGRLTAAGRTVGTILYMAPEQIRGGTLTHRADLYALGCVLYEMLTGTTPFKGSAAAEVLQRHLKDPPPHVASTMLECPLELDSLIYELLSKDADERPATAAEVANRLNAILLPSRRGNPAEPALFKSLSVRAVTKPLAIAPLKHIKPLDSEREVHRLPKKARFSSRIPWIVAAFSLLLSTQLWLGWWRTAAELHRAEQIWVALLETADPPTRVLAARALGKFDHLSPLAIGKLRDGVSSPILDIQIASLKTLAQHAAESQHLRAEMMRLQKVDENPLIRSEVELTVDAIQRAHSSFSTGGYLFWLVALAVATGVGVLGHRIWRTVQPSI